MTIKSPKVGASRAMFFASTSGAALMLRGPQIAYAPDEDGGGEIDDAFIEQPGDREPEPDDQSQPQDGDGDASGDEEGGESGDDSEGDAGQEQQPDEGAEGGTDEPEQPSPQRTDWRERRFMKEKTRREEAERRAAEAEKRVAALEELFSKPEGERGEGEPLMTPAQAREAALAQVRQEQYVQKLNSDAEALFEAGKTAFPKTWEGRVKEAAEALRDEIVARPDFLEAVVALENAPQVYHELAGDLDRMESLLAMPPHKMGIELAKISVQLARPKSAQVSKAPAPIKPLEKPVKGDLSLDDPNISQEEFNRRFDEMERRRYEGRR